MNSKPILYSYFRSSCSWRVRFALALKGIDYEIKTVDLLKKEQANYITRFSEWFRKVNPLEQVPVLIIDGHKLTQSMSIIEYLEETRPNRPLLPCSSNPSLRATVRKICEDIASGIQPLQNMATLKSVESERQQEWARQHISKGFDALERTLNETSGKYCVGDELTMADLCLAPQVFNANRFKVDMSGYLVINRVMESIEMIKEYKDSHPDNQPDTPRN